VAIIVDPGQYTNILYPQYWLTHANIDKLWAAGVAVRQRNHAGVTHMKTLITSSWATNASSNFSANWQRDHDYFVSAATKPAIWQAFFDDFNAMWNNATDFGPFVPTRPNPPSTLSPAAGATGVATTSPPRRPFRSSRLERAAAKAQRAAAKRRRAAGGASAGYAVCRRSGSDQAALTAAVTESPVFRPMSSALRFVIDRLDHAVLPSPAVVAKALPRLAIC
jgi:hypothetical protein